jgi:hypothetical protein
MHLWDVQSSATQTQISNEAEFLHNSPEMSMSQVESLNHGLEKEASQQGTTIRYLSNKECLGCLPIHFDAIKKAPSISLAYNRNHLDDATHRSQLEATPPMVLFYPDVMLCQEKCLLCRWICLAAQQRVAPTEKYLFGFTCEGRDGRIESLWIFNLPLLPRREPIVKLDCHAEDGERRSGFEDRGSN